MHMADVPESDNHSISFELSDAVADISDSQQNGCCCCSWRSQVQVDEGRNNYQRKCCTRVPRGKALRLALLLTVIESFVYFEMLNGLSKFVFSRGNKPLDIVHSWWTLGAPVAVESVAKMFYPIAGYIADVWLGRKRVTHISMWLLWAALVLLTVTVLIDPHISDVLYYIIISVVFVLFSIGVGGFETNVIPLGVDQLQGASAEELSSYFYWYYWSRQVGALIAILVFFLLQMVTYQPLKASGGSVVIQCLAATFVFSIGMMLYALFNNWLKDDTPPNNPLRLIINVTYYALTVKSGPPRHRRAFRYGEERKPRFELAKKDFDGIYESEEVENVKTFYLICMVLMSYVFFSFTYGVAFVAIEYQAFNLLFTIHNTSSIPGVYYLSQNLGTLLSSSGLAVALPFANIASSFLCSSSLYSKGSLRVKMGIGCVLLLISSLGLFCVVRIHYHPPLLVSLLLLLLPGFFLLLSEMFGIVTLLEFICAQSPQNTKGLLIGLFWFIFGFFNGVGRLAFSFVEHEYTSVEDPFYNSVLLLYVVLVVSFAVMGLVMYVMAAVAYKNRKRPQPAEDDLKIRNYAISYYSRHFQSRAL